MENIMGPENTSEIEEAIQMLSDGKEVAVEHPGTSGVKIIIKPDGSALIHDEIAAKDNEYQEGQVELVDQIINKFEQKRDNK